MVGVGAGRSRGAGVGRRATTILSAVLLGGAAGVPAAGARDGWTPGGTRLIHDGADTRLVVVDPVTFRQAGPATPIPSGSSLVSAADGRLLVSAGYRSTGGSSILVLGNP